MRNALIVLAVVLAVTFGAFAVVAGEADDSPGLQGVGVLLAIAAVVVGVRAIRKGAPADD